MTAMRFHRRTLLRGLFQGGATAMALPLLDCFLDGNGTALADGRPIPVRFGTFFWGCGLTKALFLPKSTGTNYEDTPQLASLKPFKLSFARYEVLRLLAFSRTGTLPLSSVVARLQVHATSLTSTAERLVRDGLVTRDPHPHDGRAALLTLTDAGRDLVERATLALNTDVFRSPGVNAEDAAALVGVVARLRRNAGDFTDPRPTPDPL